MTLSQPRDEAVTCPPLIQVPVASSGDKVTWRMAEGIYGFPHLMSRGRNLERQSGREHQMTGVEDKSSISFRKDFHNL